jgi:hypothetical protein
MSGDILKDFPSDNWDELQLFSDSRLQGRRPRVLLWCNYDPDNAATICDHVNAIYKMSKTEVFIYPTISPMPSEVDFDSFDVVIIHYSLALGLDAYISQKDRERLRESKAYKCAFIQDEYRFVNRTKRAVLDLGISAIFTCLDPETTAYVYGPEICERVIFTRVLTGYTSNWLLIERAKPLLEREIDVGYRGRSYSAWLGDSAFEKVRIGREFKKDARAAGLKVDIAWGEKDRLYGVEWTQFQQDCKAVLSSETALGEIDFTGELSAKIEAYEEVSKAKTFSGEFRRQSYSTVRAKFFSEGAAPSRAPQLSPRTLEAACLRTALIMYEGEYSGFFEAWENYIPLKKDHSNMDAVLKAFRNIDQLSEIIANAYATVSSSSDLDPKAMVADLDSWIFSLPLNGDRVTAYLGDREEFHKEYKFEYVSNPHVRLRSGNGLGRLVQMLANNL